MITIDSQKDGFVFKFPQNVNEVKTESLVELTKNYTLGKGKVMLCLIGQYNLFALRTAIRGSKDVNVVIAPVIAKLSKDVEESLDFHVGEGVVIAPTDVERGIHVDVSCGASYSNLQRLVSSYKEFADAIMNNSVVDENGNSVSDICALTFKIVNAFDIVATMHEEEKNDEYIEPIRR